MTLSDPPKSADLSAARATTVRRLVETVGPPVIQVLAAPRGLDQPVRGSVLHDPVDPLPEGADELVLMPGLQADGAASADLVREVARLGYSAIVLKLRGVAAGTLVAQAELSGVAVLAAADEVSWRHLDALLLSVLGSHGAGRDATNNAGDELFALANAIAAVIGGSVAIEDLDRRVMAYSSMPDQHIDVLRRESILNRLVPEIEHNLERYRTVLRASDVVRFPEALGALPRAAIAIKAGTQPLGSIWAIEGPGGIGADGKRALIDGARLAALHMLRSRTANELDFQMRGSTLLGALDGLRPAHEVAFRLSIAPGTDLGLVGFAIVPDAIGSLASTAHLGSALSRFGLPFRPDACVATTARAVYVLLPGGGSEAAKRLARGALSAIRPTFGEHVRAAIAPTEADPAALPAMRREIDDILRVTTVHPDLPAVAELADVHTRVLLARVADELDREPRLRHPGVATMAAYDAEHRTDYAASVLAWLDAVGDMTQAAARLGVHHNTLRYRLRRAAELFDMPLDNPDDRLSSWLQLRLVPR